MSKFDDNLELTCIDPEDICSDCGMTRKEHKGNLWIGKAGHCSGFVKCVTQEKGE